MKFIFLERKVFNYVCQSCSPQLSLPQWIKNANYNDNRNSKTKTV